MSQKTIFLSLDFTRARKARLKSIILLYLSTAFVAYSLLGRLGSTTDTPPIPLEQFRNVESHYANDKRSDLEVPNNRGRNPPLLDVPSPPPKLKERALTHERAVRKGREIFCNIINYDTTREDYPAQSLHQDPTSLREYGWDTTSGHDVLLRNANQVMSVLGSALADLQLSQDPTDYTEVWNVHALPYTQGSSSEKNMVCIAETAILGSHANFTLNFASKQETSLIHLQPQATGACYGSLYNHNQATFIVHRSLSPGKTDLVKAGVIPMPDLKQMSDVTFLNWKRLAGSADRIASLKYIISYHVVTPNTRGIVAELERLIEEPIPDYPGVDFPISDADDKGLAILGTPQGAAVGYFLIQHKDALPQKTVSKVRVWKTPSLIENLDPWVHMIFFIDDIIPSPPGSPPPSIWKCLLCGLG
jgi:hypothetical protein